MFNTNNFDLIKKIQRNNEERNKIFRKMFGKFMKQNSLINIKEEIKKSIEFNNIIPECYDFQLNPVLAVGVDDIDYDICVNLAMIFWYDNLFETDEFKSKRLRDSNYIKSLKSRTILQCRLRKLKQSFGNNYYYLSHTPLNYIINCVVNYLLDGLNNKKQSQIKPIGANGNFKINTIVVLLKNIQSILLLTESDNCGSAFSLLRMVIEMTCVYFTIGNNEKVADDYYNFIKYRAEFELNGNYPNEFLTRTPKNVHLQNYLNYGWLDMLDNTKHKYIFSELLNYTQVINEELKDHFLVAYKYCCKYSHGNYLNQSIGPYDFVWILGRIGLILTNLAQEYSELFNDNMTFNGINLVNLLKEITNESFKLYSKHPD